MMKKIEEENCVRENCKDGIVKYYTTGNAELHSIPCPNCAHNNYLRELWQPTFVSGDISEDKEKKR